MAKKEEPEQRSSYRMKLPRQHSKGGSSYDSIPDYPRFTTFASTVFIRIKRCGDSGLLESILNQVLQAQATEQLKAGHYERSEERAAYRNGSYPHRLTTRVGQLTLQVPRFRNGRFSTELFSRYQRSEQALVLAMMEMVLNGVSTRKISNITEELCGTEFSKSTVSELCKQLDPLVEEWNNRKLDKPYPFLIVDALYVKVREDGRVRSRGVMIATGINAEGYRELLGLTVDDTESAATWGAFFTHLKSRGLHGVDVITSDHHGGLVSARMNRRLM